MARSRSIGILLIATAITATAAARPDFIPLPNTSASRFDPAGVSGDGSIVVGRDGVAGYAALWRRSSGVQLLVPFTGFAADASYDGSAVVGSSQASAFRWTASSVTTIQPPLGYVGFGVHAVSADGELIVGDCQKYPIGPEIILHPFRWTAAGGFQNILTPLPGWPGSNAYDVSGDGDVVIGAYQTWGTIPYNGNGWRWTVSGGTVPLPTPVGFTRTTPRAISKDGATIVGYASYSVYVHPKTFIWYSSAYRWTPQPQVIESDYNNFAEDVSADGSVVIGTARPDANTAIGWIWTAATGSRDLKQVLLDLGVTAVTGWKLTEPSAISDDGTVIAGRGYNPAGQQASWVAYLDDPCYPDCNTDGALTVADFGCFQTKFVAADPYADCNADGALTVQDFGCFRTRFVQGCP